MKVFAVGTGCTWFKRNNTSFIIDEKILSKMNEEYDLKYWYKDKKIVRIATTFATTEADIKSLVSKI